ncbi:hypothetical protein [Streptomyces sp. KL116D]|uniref:hypothetical protein n=1 Tax=Streptomyces sp. KL116D TaxID=3045152 RepID=UPI0035584442
MDNWREDALPGQTHDPNEVTVQLDGAGRQLGELLAARGQTGPAEATGDDKEVPVFVDDSGRRSRRFRRIGVFLGIACAVYAVVIVATLLSGNSSAPWLPMDPEKPAGKVDTKPLPADPEAPSVSPGTTPDPSASGTAPGATGAPGTSTSPTADASTGDDEPGTGTTPSDRPTGGKTTPPVEPSKPGGHTTPPVDPTTDPPTDPSTPPVDPTDDPTTDPVGGGTDTVADGTSSPQPVDRSPSGEPSAPTVASQESSVL